MATIKINSWKTQRSIYSSFRLFQESIFLAIAWREKEKIRIFVWCLTDNAVMTMRLTIGVTLSGSQPGSQRHVSRKRRQKSISSGKPILRFLKINNQNYRPIARVTHIFSLQLYTGIVYGFHLVFKASILVCLQFWEEAGRDDDSFWLFYGL